MNPMREIRINKVTLNIGAGKDQAKLEKAMVLLKKIGNATPVKRYTNKRIPEWELRPGLPIGCKLTLRKNKAINLLPALLNAHDNMLNYDNFDKEGNISFGIAEYIDIPGIKYDPAIGIIGLQVCITLQRAGFRIRDRKIKTRNISARHRIKKEEAIEFMKNKFNLNIEQSQEMK